MIINYPNEDLYEGSMVDGKIEGRGKLIQKGVSEYEGDFVNEVYHGEGTFTAGQFEYAGTFENGNPTIFPNQIAFKSLMVEEPEDPKAKKAPPKKGQEEDEDPNPNKLKFQVGKDPLQFEIRFEFQGPDYISSEPPTEEELKQHAAERKKKGEDWQPEPKMVTPPPELISIEKGRELEFELGRLEQVEVEEGQPPKQEWKAYPFFQDSTELKHRQYSEAGLVKIENLAYNVTEDFKSGRYTLKVQEVTKNAFKTMPEISISITILSAQEEEAAKGSPKKK